MKIATLSIIALSLICKTYAAEKVELSEKEPSTVEGEYLYQIVDNEVLVNDKLITLIVVGKDSLSASYRNKTEEKKRPKYTIKAYNPYGLMVGQKVVGKSSIMFGNNTYMEPGEVSAEKIHMDKYPLSEIIENSSLALPDDLMEIKWIVLSDTNTK